MSRTGMKEEERQQVLKQYDQDLVEIEAVRLARVFVAQLKKVKLAVAGQAKKNEKPKVQIENDEWGDKQVEKPAAAVKKEDTKPKEPSKDRKENVPVASNSKPEAVPIKKEAAAPIKKEEAPASPKKEAASAPKKDEIKPKPAAVEESKPGAKQAKVDAIKTILPTENTMQAVSVKDTTK